MKRSGEPVIGCRAALPRMVAVIATMALTATCGPGCVRMTLYASGNEPAISQADALGADSSRDRHWDAAGDAAGDAGDPDAGPRDAEGVDVRLADAPEVADAGSDQAISDSVVVQPGPWVTIPSGTFTMGSPAGEACRTSAREDPHGVTLTRSFVIHPTETTQGQFESLMGYNPSNFGPNGGGGDCGPDCPVERVSWHEAAAYCNSLSSLAALTSCYACTGSAASVTCNVAPAYSGANIYSCPGYRLPTDAEWEYAYRSGTKTAYYSGANDPAACHCSPEDASLAPIAWYCGNAGDTTHPVKQKQANALHLYDMAGNVWEWCHDSYEAALGLQAVTDPCLDPTTRFRVLRGGSWQDNANDARAAYRFNQSATVRSGTIGFRCARTVGQP